MKLKHKGEAVPKQIAAREISIGTTVVAETESKVFCDAPELRLHADKPWMNYHLKDRYGLDLSTGNEAQKKGSSVSIPESLLTRHAVICGASGSGKTRLALHLLTEQLKSGCSAVVIDFKEDTIRQALSCAEMAGLKKEQITLIWPREVRHGIPGWNPFGEDPSTIRQAVREFVGIIEATTTSWGPRLQDVLTNAATIVAGQGLSILELTRFLQIEAYRTGLLQAARNTSAFEEFREEHHYFLSEFSSLSRGEQAQAVAPVLNKIRTLVSMKYLRAMLCAKRDTVALPSLWQEQRLIAVHLDTFELGQDGTKLLSGMLCHSLFHTAMRKSGNVPVVLCLDEMGMQERFVGRAIEDILAMARSQNLRLLSACQHMDQLSECLKSALLTNTAFRAFFRLGYDDARRVGQSFGQRIKSEPVRVSLGITRNGKYEPPDKTKVVHSIFDMYNRPLQMSDPAWEVFSKLQTQVIGITEIDTRLVDGLIQLSSVSQVPRIYVGVPASETVVELSEYVEKLPQNCFYFLGPRPIRLVIIFPKPKVTNLPQAEAEDSIGDPAVLLQKLGVREAFVRTDTGIPQRMKVVNIPFPGRLPGPEHFLSTGQSAYEIRECERQRDQGIEILSGIQALNTQDTHTQEVVSRELEQQKNKSLKKQGGGIGKTDRRSVNAVLNSATAIARIIPSEPEIADDGSL